MAVVLNWNRPEMTLACVASLGRVSYPALDIVVVDNGSSDGSEALIRAARPDLILLQTGSNKGYGAGNNVGIADALVRGADLVWILNNDTIVDPDALDLVEAAWANPKVGVMATTLVDRPDNAPRRDASGTAFRWRRTHLRRVDCVATTAQCSAKGHEVDVVRGASMLLRAELLREVGGFDERYFHYFEDIELCDRARAAGWEVRHLCRGRVRHHGSATLANDSAEARRYYVRNWILFFRWSRGYGWSRLILTGPFVFFARVTGVRWLLRRQWRVASAGWAGVLDAAHDRHGPIVAATSGRDGKPPADVGADAVTHE